MTEVGEMRFELLNHRILALGSDRAVMLAQLLATLDVRVGGEGGAQLH